MTNSQTVAADLMLQSDIAAARRDAERLEHLREQAARLPELERQQHLRDVRRRADEQMGLARESASQQLEVAATQLADIRSRVTAIAGQVASLVRDLDASQVPIHEALAMVSDAVEADVSADYANADLSGPRGTSDMYLEARARWGVAWHLVGGESQQLAALPESQSRLERGLIRLIARSVGGVLYHPKHADAFCPLRNR